MTRLASLLILFSFSFLFYSCEKRLHLHESPATSEKLKSKTYYTCSMHPKVRENKPGKCPICHMNLTKVEVDLSESSTPTAIEKVLWQCKDYPDITSEQEGVCPIDGSSMIKKENSAAKVVARVRLRKAQLSHFMPSFFPATPMRMSKKIRLLGSVFQSEEKESTIPARIAGRVEKVYIKSTGSLVNISDPVVDLYSPSLITAGEEYLLARKGYNKDKSKAFRDLLRQSKEKLKLLGIKEFQLESWYKTSKVPQKITIYSNVSGIVQVRNATKGKYFKEGENFLKLTDLGDVWVEMDVYEHDSSLIRIGQKVSLMFTAIPGEIIEGEINFINPVLDPQTRTLKVRTTIKNKSGKLKPGMIANAELFVKIAGTPLVIPRTAVIDTGKRKVVWTQLNERKYQAKTILTGYESEGYVEVKKGLKEGEKVVIDGNFLLDAQAQLFGGYEEFNNSNDSSHTH